MTCEEGQSDLCNSDGQHVCAYLHRRVWKFWTTDVWWNKTSAIKLDPLPAAVTLKSLHTNQCFTYSSWLDLCWETHDVNMFSGTLSTLLNKRNAFIPLLPNSCFILSHPVVLIQPYNIWFIPVLLFYCKCYDSLCLC